MTCVTAPDTRHVSVDFLPSIASVDHASWQGLLKLGDTDAVFLTREWQETWWDTYGRGQLLYAAARRRDELVAIAPLFADEDGMVYFVGSGGCGSDYLDFIGDVSDAETLDALLDAARQQVANFTGFRFYFIPNQSRSGVLLHESARRLGLSCRDEGSMPAPVLDLRVPGAAHAAVSKKSLRRHERFFEREGHLLVRESSRATDILPRLESFFAQHIDRWASTPFPSLFLKESHRRFYRRIASEASDAGWLRFMTIDRGECLIAAHLGFHYNGRYLWYKPSFAIALARHSPGELLLSRLLHAAIREDAQIFDFGLGEETFKQRFATSSPAVTTFGLYASTDHVGLDES